MKKGYYTYYNKEGKKLKIKVSKKFSYDDFPKTVIIRFTEKGSGERKYHIPKKEFKDINQVISYIVKHTVNDHLSFKIIDMF
jgi:hypothetical protein